ncbi:MAG: RDD family protein [Parvularculaceae bacterium]|nr:RDD family protein [Parvularculaceae bacterium]
MSSTVPTSQPQMSYGYGGFWWRFLAVIVDLIVVGLLTGVATPILFVLPVLIPIAPLLVDAGYSIFMESSPTQGTVGKMICRLKVADLAGKRITPGKAGLRYVGKYVSGLIMFLGYILVFFTSKKQALHDLMAGTVVLKINEHNENADPIRGFHEEQQAQATAAQIPHTPASQPAAPAPEASEAVADQPPRDAT